MLGAARASQYAGWWGGPPKFLSTSEVDMTYQGQFTGTISLTTNGYGDPDDTRTFDNTGIANGARGTQVITFKYQAQSNFTWATDAFRPSYELIKYDSGAGQILNASDWTYEYQSSQDFWNIVLARTVTGNYLSVLATYKGYDFFTLSGNLAWDTYADRWMTLIASYSSDVTDFANWTGVTGGSNYYLRLVLQDATTGELISATDARYNAFQSSDINWANYTWSWDSGSSGSSTTANTNMPTLAGNSGSLITQTDMLGAAIWCCQGAVVDPLATVDSVVLRNYFVGSCFPETVNGARAWFNATPFAVTTSGSDTLVTKALPARAAQTNNYAYKNLTSNLATPVSDTSIP